MCSLRVIRIDFVPDGSRCNLCAQPLEMAHIVVDGGAEKHYGPDCVKKLSTTPEFKASIIAAPNLTRRSGKQPAAVGTKRGISAGTSQDDAFKRASEYLWLRLDKIVKLCPQKATSLSWPPLKERFDALRNEGGFTAADVAMVLKIEAKAPPELRRLNLLDVYAAANQLERKLSRRPDPYLDGFLHQLKHRLWLSKAQIACARIQLPATAFRWDADPAKACT